MVDAALAYAAHGFPIFPVTVDKIPVPPRDRDANGKPIPGTGGFKKATTDPIQIRAWWRQREYLIGLPMGSASGVCCIDVDTSEDHADGVAEWDKIAAQHEPIVTREHRSATGGPHLIFDFDAAASAAAPASCPRASRSRARAATSWCRRRAARAAPTRSTTTSIPARCRCGCTISSPRDGNEASSRPGVAASRYCGQVTADAEEVAEAMAWIPNDERWLGRLEVDGAAALCVARGLPGSSCSTHGRRNASQVRSDKTLEAWEQIEASPPDHTGAGAIFKRARQHGWTPRLFECAPTYPAS